LDHDVHAEVAPRQLGRLAFGQDLDRLVAGLYGVAGHRHVGGQGAEHGVVLEQVRHRGDVTEVVRRDDVDATVAVRGVGGPPEVTADAAETIDSYANCHSTKSPRRSRDRQPLRDYRTPPPEDDPEATPDPRPEPVRALYRAGSTDS